jgi:hypothetical protein
LVTEFGIRAAWACFDANSSLGEVVGRGCEIQEVVGFGEVLGCWIILVSADSSIAVNAGNKLLVVSFSKTDERHDDHGDQEGEEDEQENAVGGFSISATNITTLNLRVGTEAEVVDGL